ncbi:MAG: DNA-binding protein [Acidobacteria bacterium RIFCSPLOWO2_12_FULL_66_21]|nr:MAG: DNA-binding protein [Acidobacteria bacterium RIFCSPLOWO2_12_FULL_66_21]
MIVVDTNVLAYLWLPGELTAVAERVLEADAAWAAPLLWRSEFRSVLTGALRRRTLSLARARQIAAAAERQLHGSEYAVSSAVVLELALRSGCSAYDCEYVALAADLGVPLVTNDRHVLAAFPDRAASPDSFAGRAR